VTVAVAFVVGFLASRLVFLLLRPVFEQPVFLRQNFRGKNLPTGVGLVLAVAVLVVEATRAIVATAVDGRSPLGPVRTSAFVLVVGFGLLGLLDDLAGSGERRGFRGHLRSAARGQLTTGAAKLFGGGAVAVVAVAIVRPNNNLLELLTDAAVVGLAANLGNLLDVAPGRTVKVGAASFVVLVAATAADPRLGGAAVVAGAACALLLDDLRERVMLGDAGANVIGGAVGLAVVAVGSPIVRLAALGVLAVLNGVSEWVSFSRVIELVPPLRFVDRAGRRR
jgi:UDP-N-acetylmuramyl pentapeptide phosphotransferase/UDP-N-acetylglucosamine-1-phosphate transferase